MNQKAFLKKNFVHMEIEIWLYRPQNSFGFYFIYRIMKIFNKTDNFVYFEDKEKDGKISSIDKISEILFFGKMPPLKLALKSCSIPGNDNWSIFSVDIIGIYYDIMKEIVGYGANVVWNAKIRY